MNKCKIIKDITNEIIKGGNADELIPYDIRMLDDDGKAEMLMLYIRKVVLVLLQLQNFVDISINVLMVEMVDGIGSMKLRMI